MQLRVPGLELVEPLRPRPVYGALIGALTGLGFGVLTFGRAFPTSWLSQASGYILGGLAAGLIVGASLPLFRSRWTAGGIAAIAAAAALFIAQPLWGEQWGTSETLFIAGCIGVIYSRLIWDYRAAARAEPTDSLHRST